jgi:copper(I)-binding protein
MALGKKETIIGMYGCRRRSKLEQFALVSETLMNLTLKRGALVIVFACAALAHSGIAADSAAATARIKISDAWVRAPAPGQTTAGAYVELTSDRDAAIVAAGSPAAARVEMHSTSTEGGVMRMRAVPRIELPAGRSVKLGAGGTHLMLIDVKKALKAGDKVPLTLSVQPAGAAAGMSLTTVALEAVVRKAASGEPHKH